MVVLILISKETYNTLEISMKITRNCNFPGAGGGGRGGGAGGPDLLTPTSLWIQKSRESVETIDTPKYTVVQYLHVDITNCVYVLLWTIFKYNKGR